LPVNISQLLKVQGNRASIPNKENLENIFSLIIKEAISSIGAKRGALYFPDENGILKSTSQSTSPLAYKIANSSFRDRKNFLLKKETLFEQEYSTESYLSCFLGEEGLEIGAFVLEGIDHFENFSIRDFDLFSVYSNTLTLLLKESFEVTSANDIFLKLSTSALFLLHSVDNYQKNTHLEYLLKEVIRVSGLINSSSHLDSLLREVMESVKSVFKTESCSILLVDKAKNDLYFHLIAGEKEEEISKIRVPMGKGIAGTVAISREPMIINDAQNDDRVYKVVDKSSGFVTRNILAAPLVAGDETVGVIEAINTIDRNNFNETDIDLFLSFSDAAALAIQKTRLLEDLEKSNKDLAKTVGELGSLYELGLAVNESKDDEDLFFRSIKIISKELRAVRAAIFVVSEDLKMLKVKSLINGNYETTSEKYIEESVIVSSITQNKILHHESYVLQKENLGPDIKFISGPYIIIPMLFSDGKPFGAISISEPEDKNPFTSNQLRLLLTISSQFVKGYENIKLNRDMLAKKAMEKEIEITRNIQNNILPAKLPGGSNFEIGVKTVPAKEVSGDFYDSFKYSDGQFSFLIADVSGKSLPAAIFMAMSSSIIRTLGRNHDLSPDEILRQSNSLIYEDSQSGMFVTLFFIHYNPSTMEIQFASAGHNDQLWIKSDGSYELMKGKGAPLGVIPTGNYVGGMIKPSIGDIIVLYTDGAVEEKDPQDNEYGLDKFAEEIIKRKHLKPQQIADEIFQEIHNFAQGNEQFDDFTVMILKFNDDYQFKKVFPAKNSQIPILRDFIYNTIKVREVDEIACEDILLCCDEAGTNIVMHSYKDTTLKNPTFECSIKFTDDTLEILLRDQGKQFLRENVPKPSLEANLRGERRGGFGVFIMEKMMDQVEYRYVNGFNETTMRKKI
jgi:sigma-B regulation protein RsbU (phosphoserine phosphatase)